MNKNLQKGVREGDRHKPTLNIAINQRHFIQNSHSAYNLPYSPKTAKETHQPKSPKMPRYASEEEFKRFHLSNSQIYTETLEPDSADQFRKLKLSTESKEERGKPRGSAGSAGSNEFVNPYSQLKETTSTTSADHFSVHKKTAPAFLKAKSRNAQVQKLAKEPVHMNKTSQEDFRIIKKLGEGKFGKVFLVRDLATGFILALKVVEKKKIIEDNLLQQFVRQLKIQTYLNHPNIIKVYGFFSDEKYFYTLMELGSDGQLYNLISGQKKITEQATSFISKNLLQAIECMHSNKILHRDIKPQNIVLIMGNVKICDFGWAVNKATKYELRSTYCGTPLYLSPEILKMNRYDEKVDIWAVGILAYELLLGTSPFEIYEQSDLYKITTDDVVFPPGKKISKEFQEFILCILKKNPKERMTSSELLNLNFIQKYDGFETCQQLCQ